jgi:hypothetical protein
LSSSNTAFSQRATHAAPDKIIRVPYFWMWFGIAMCLALWLRLDQFLDQTLLDDEWHAVHQIVLSSPSRFLLSFGHADYSIPLTLLYWLQARSFGLSELGMRLPLMLAGLATVAFFPVVLRKEFSDRMVLLFAFFLACSPMLIAFSRMARPYALTLLLSFAAYALLEQATRDQTRQRRFGAGYVICAALALWLHPIAGPFLIAPLVMLWWAWLRGVRDGAAPSLVFLLVLTAATGLAMAAAVLPPLLADPVALSGKSGGQALNLEPVIGVWYGWLGTGSTMVVIASLCLAAIGARRVCRASRVIRWALVGLGLTALVVVATRPAWINHPLVLARYLLPALPLLLLFMVAGMDRLMGIGVSAGVGIVVGLVALACWVPTSPLASQLQFPNSNTLHMVALVEPRASHNLITPHLNKFPLSPFWSSLSNAPAGSITIAVAPFRFESFDWPAPVWEAQSRQRVLPAFVSGTCVPWLHGNTPHDAANGARFQFRNAVQLGDADALRRAKVTYLAFFRAGRNSLENPEKHYLPECETWMRNRYGTPTFEDGSLVVWKVGAA